jgi:hypothetical protein
MPSLPFILVCHGVTVTKSILWGWDAGVVSRTPADVDSIVGTGVVGLDGVEYLTNNSL